MMYIYVVVILHFGGYDVGLRPQSCTTNISQVWQDMNQELVLLHSLRFFLYEAAPTAFFLTATAIHDNYFKHCTLYGLEW